MGERGSEDILKLRRECRDRCMSKVTGVRVGVPSWLESSSREGPRE